MMEKEQIEQIWDNLLFTKLLETLKLAVGPSRLVIAMLGVIVICLIGWVMDICSMTVIVNPRRQPRLKPVVLVEDLTSRTELDVYVKEVYLKGPVSTETFINRHKEKGKRGGVFSTLWSFCAARFNVATVSLFKLEVGNVFIHIWLCVVALFWAIKYHTIYSIILFVTGSVVICVCGGAICRSAALEFARGEKPGLIEALRFGVTKFLSLLAAPAVAIGIMAFFAMFVVLLGLAGSLGWGIGDLIMGLGLPAAMIFGLLTVMMLVGTVTGGGLMFPVIAYEGSGGLEAVSRSFAYALTQPLRMLFYTSVAVVYGTISYLFIRFFAFLLLIVSYFLLDLGVVNGSEGGDKLSMLWPRPDFFNLPGPVADVSMKWSQSVSAFLIRLTVLFIVCLVVAFVVNFYFCANTIIYSLMRKNVDNVDIDEIYVELDEIRDQEQEQDSGNEV